MTSLDVLNDRLVSCKRCPRLVQWREQVAVEKRRSFELEEYWGRPVPCFGDPGASRLIVGLAPAAHGANRTGRMFTGDRSGDWLFRALHKAGVANQPSSTHLKDGLELKGAIIAAVCHCAPPENKPTPNEIRACSSYLIELLGSRKWSAILCLGSISWNQVHRLLGAKPPKFGHEVTNSISNIRMVASYHPSQQNTFTGKLTEEMLDSAIADWLSDFIDE
jgi:uracil-DNA glycosylase family 4